MATMKRIQGHPAPRGTRPRRGCRCCADERGEANRKDRRANRNWIRANGSQTHDDDADASPSVMRQTGE